MTVQENLFNSSIQSDASEGLFWAYPIGSELALKTLDVIQEISQTEAATNVEMLNRKVAEVLKPLTEDGLVAYYHRPSETIEMSPLLRKTADAGVNSVKKAIFLVIQTIFKKMPLEQLKALAGYMESMIYRDGEDGEYHVAFVLEAELAVRASELIERVRTDRLTKLYMKELIQALGDLVHEGVEHYYSKPSDLITLGRITKKAADIGIDTAEKGVRGLIRKILRELPHDALVQLADYVETLMLPIPDTQLTVGLPSC